MKKSIFFSFAAVFIMMSAPVASAQDVFESIVSDIVDNNPSLKSRKLDISAQRADDADDNALADPQVEVGRVWGRHGIGNKLQIDVSQEFDWPGVYAQKRKAADFAAEAASYALDSERRDLVATAKASLFELVYVRQQLVTAHLLLDNILKLSDAVDTGVKGGELTVIDQHKAAFAKFEAENNIYTLQQREMEIMTDLQALSVSELDLSGVSNYPIQPFYDMEEYLKSLESDPALLEQVSVAMQEEYNAKSAQMSRFPSFSVGYQHQAEMGDRFNGFTFGLNIPVFQGRNAKRAALERKDAADLNREMLIAEKSADISGIFAHVSNIKRQIDGYNGVFGDNKYLDLLLKAYKGGQISVLDYISEVQYYHETASVYLELEYNYNVALAALNRYFSNF